MRLLLDTHIALWAVVGSRGLAPEAKRDLFADGVRDAFNRARGVSGAVAQQRGNLKTRWSRTMDDHETL